MPRFKPSLRLYLQQLADRNALLVVDEPCDPELEIAEIAHRVMAKGRGAKTLLFTNTGTEFPLAINLYCSRQRMLNVLRASSYEMLGLQLEQTFDTLLSPTDGVRGNTQKLRVLSRIAKTGPRRTRRSAPCQEVVQAVPSLSKLPILRCWPADGGRFITLPMVITQDPASGARNVGMYRAQVMGDNTLAMHWHVHKTGAAHFRAYREAGQSMPVVIALGGDPILAYSATAPLPEGIDEWLLAGYLRGEPVRLVPGKTVPLLVPAEADFIIEGYIDPSEPPVLEGPFGDHTGFYSLPDYYPAMHVTAITHREDAIYPATIVGVPPMEDAHIAEATERIFSVPLRKAVAPEIIDFCLPTAGTAHNLAIVATKSYYPGQAQRLANLFWSTGQLMFTKFLVVVDQSVDMWSYRAVTRALIAAAKKGDRFYLGQGTLDVLDHASPEPLKGGKLLLDARYEEHERPTTPPERLHRKKRTIAGSRQALTYHLGNEPVALIIPTENELLPLDAFSELVEGSLEAPFVVLIDETAPWQNPYLLFWLALANIAPDVDIKLLSKPWGTQALCDARRKAKRSDRREWPNPVASSPETIKAVDEKWEKLGIGAPLPSPSRVILPYQLGPNAIAREE